MEDSEDAFTWRQLVALNHRRWECRPPRLVAAHLVQLPPPPKVQPQYRQPPPEPLVAVKGPADILGGVDLHGERAKRLTKVSSAPVIKRLLVGQPRQSREEPGGVWAINSTRESEEEWLQPRRARGREYVEFVHPGRNSLGAALVPNGVIHKAHEAKARNRHVGQYTQYSRPKGQSEAAA